MTKKTSRYKYPPRIKGSNTDPDLSKEIFSIKLLEKENPNIINESVTVDEGKIEVDSEEDKETKEKDVDDLIVIEENKEITTEKNEEIVFDNKDVGDKSTKNIIFKEEESSTLDDPMDTVEQLCSIYENMKKR